MRCLVTGGNVKVLGKAVHSLSRIGDELYVDPTEDGLSLRAVNSSRSAYACFLFAPLFFQLYEEGSPDPDGEPFRCKVFMKESPRPTTCHSKSANCYRLFSTRSCAPTRCAPLPEPSRTMVTELCLSEDEFQDVQVQQQSHVTFCLKEFRGLLSFAESSNLPLNIHFDTPGRPAIFTLSDPLLEVHLVLATLSDPNSSSQVCSTTLQARPANGAFPMATPDDDFMGDDIDSYMIAMETTCEEGPGLPSSPTFPQRRPHPGAALESENSAMESDLEGAVPGTPPQKKFRSLFFGSVLTQSQVGTHPGPSQDVLAEDSEGES
ncbi:cell cycle checkpoint control protein RAD9A isoform X3 [Chrysemys picta bellii]|uniref:cell cycle checkpoint control protein RAD9A isoform X3 n=1 Tax=Chrysemys picta bellii TaxID=8478 RepID=UPI0032B1B79A